MGARWARPVTAACETFEQWSGVLARRACLHEALRADPRWPGVRMTIRDSRAWLRGSRRSKLQYAPSLTCSSCVPAAMRASGADRCRRDKDAAACYEWLIGDGAKGGVVGRGGWRCCWR
jgi:hypothetical protein